MQDFSWCRVCRGDTVKDFVFKEKYGNILTYIISINQGLIHVFVQDTTIQDNVGEPHIPNIIPKEQNKLYHIKNLCH